MGILNHKIDFLGIIEVHNANPNGDPQNVNMPRTDTDGYGFMTAECIKRKIRNRLMDMGCDIFVQSDDRSNDGYTSLKGRAEGNPEFIKCTKKNADAKTAKKIACESWMDVRSFGQLFAFKGDALSLGIRGAVSIQDAFSINPVNIVTKGITKSVNSEDKESKASDTMGFRYSVEFGVYLLKGSINVQMAEDNGFTDEDAANIKEALRTIFVNDASSARPEGSMNLSTLYWWEHNCKIGQYSPKIVHESISLVPKVDDPKSLSDYNVICKELPGLKPEILIGF